MSNRSNKKDIAIIGMAGKFPQSDNIHEFWNHLIKGRELTQQYSDEELKASGMRAEEINHPNFVKIGSTVNHPGTFDFSFFGYTAEEAALMDPQIRMFHEYTWLALEDAGCDPFSYAKKIGLFATASDNILWRVYALAVGKINHFYLTKISDKTFLSTLLSYKLNLRGPSYYIDTACSSSLSTLHIACRNLLMRECSIAVAGGVSISSNTAKGYHYEEGMIHSKDGHTRTFDKDSSGTYGGEGVGIVVLKRLEDALEDRDHIYAVIKASAANNDGNNKIGYTAPSVAGQSDCIRLTHRIAGIPASSISYIEAHGTATNLGDPIEIEALNLAFGNQPQKHCAIGSVKSNMGHLDAAAGVAGIIKTALSLKNKQLPPSLNYSAPNPEINFDNGPFYVNTELTDWKPSNGTPLRAGVSSFGIGGTNVHALLEEAPEIEKNSSHHAYHFLPFSAKTPQALDRYQGRLLHFLKEANDEQLSAIAYTLQTGRKAFKYRQYLVCQNREEAIQQLGGEAAVPLKAKASSRKDQIVFMFSGQGSQYINMGKDLYEQEPLFRKIMDEGFEALQQITEQDFRPILFSDDAANGAEALINNTLYTQPILFLFEYALAQLLIKWGIQPDDMIGHSLGEYVAACIGGVFSFQDGLRLVAARARIMDKAPRGAMLSIGQSLEKVAPILEEEIAVAAINSPDSTVVSGSYEAIDRLAEQLEALDLPFRKLRTSHAFHSALMDSILEEFRQAVAEVELSAPNQTFISNLSGDFITPEQATSPDYWADHLRNTVKFAEGIQKLVDRKNSIFIEIGPGKGLTTFFRQNNQHQYNNIALQTVRHPNKTINDHQVLTNLIAELWTNSCPIDFDAYHSPNRPYKTSVPGYAFEPNDFPTKVDPFALFQGMQGGHQPQKRELGDWFSFPAWKQSHLMSTHSQEESKAMVLLFSDDRPIFEALIHQLKQDGHLVAVVRPGQEFSEKNRAFTIDPDQVNHYTRLAEALTQQSFNFDQIVYGWAFPESHSIHQTSSKLAIPEVMTNGVIRLLHLFQQLKLQEVETPKKITLLSDSNEVVLGNENIDPGLGVGMSLLQVAGQENPNLFNTCLDLDMNIHIEQQLVNIINELKYNTKDHRVAYRHQQRWVSTYQALRLPEVNTSSKVKAQAYYLITGGLGYVGMIFAEHLAKNHQANIILLGRSALPPEEEWGSASMENGIQKKVSKIESLRSYGGQVVYRQGDVSNANAFEALVTQVEQQYGALSGVIHAAGNVDTNTFKAIEQIQQEIIAQQFQPKVNGLVNLYTTFKDRPLDFVWITSSLSAIVGGLTFGAYAAANAFMDAFINAKQAELKHWQCINLDGLGEGSDMVINGEQLIDIFERSLRVGRHQLIVSMKDIEAYGKAPAQPTVPELPNAGPIVVEPRPFLATDYEKPTNEMEEQLAVLWQEFFGIEQIGILDDFFELGGDSLKVMTICKRIYKQFDVEISVFDFYNHANIKSLAAEIGIAQKIMDMKKQKSSGKKMNEIKI